MINSVRQHFFSFKVVCFSILLATLFSCKKETARYDDPIVTINNLKNIGYKKISYVASVKYENILAVRNVGICWSETNTEPTIDDNSEETFNNLEAKSIDFFGEVESLNLNTSYYFRAYIFIGNNIFYSDVVKYKTGKGWTGNISSNLISQTNKYFYAMHFFNENTGHIAGQNGAYYTTSDAGTTWNQIPQSHSEYIVDLKFINENIGFMAPTNITSYTSLRKTIDGGQTWQELNVEHTHVITALHPISEDVLYIGTTFSTNSSLDSIKKSIDGGQTWTSIKMTIYGNYIIDFDFISSSLGYCASRGGEVFKTTDSGTSWDKVSQSTIGTTTYDLEFLSELEGIAVGSEGIFKTYDGGETWHQKEEDAYYLNVIDFIDVNIGVTASANGQIWRTTDGGETWSLDWQGSSNISIEAIQLLNPDLGFAITNGNLILKYQ